MTFLVKYLEIFTTFSLQAKCFHDIFSLHFHYIFTTNFHYMAFSLHLFTTFSLQIFTTKGRTDRDEQTPWGHTDRFSLHFHYIFMTILSQAANLHIFTTIFTTFSRQSYHGQLICIFSLHFHDIFTTFSRHFHYIFTTILSQAANLHIFTTIFTTFSRQSYHGLLICIFSLQFSLHLHHTLNLLG